MKTMRTFTRFFTLAAGFAVLVLYFFPSMKLAAGDFVHSLTGAELAFGGTVRYKGFDYHTAKSTYYLFVLILIALGTLLSGLSFKFKGSAYAAPVFFLISGISFTVFLCTNNYFVDARPIRQSIQNLTYTPELMYFILYGVIILAFVLSVVALLVADHVDVLESNGAKKSIFKRIISFFSEYKSEIKKIIWPGPRSVVKNTVIVLVICLIFGAFVWALDWLFGFGVKELFTSGTGS